MDSGKLRDRIAIESKSTTRDDNGQPVNSWTEFARVWAWMKYPKGKEVLAADQVKIEIHASVRIRYREDINENMRVTFKGKIFDIHAILPDPDREFLDLMVTIGTNEG